MCTVTYLPLLKSASGFVLTDNRDESINRPAQAPQKYAELQSELYYPRDKKAGGTWIGVGKEKHLITLMNGAFKPHQRKVSYRKSRGVVVKELLSAARVKPAFLDYELEGVEAFFAVVVSWKKGLRLYEMIWDGNQRFVFERNPEEPFIWSSAMLYTPSERAEREAYFQAFSHNFPVPEKPAEALWEFHHSSGLGGENIKIDRGVLQTTSISQYTHGFKGEDYFRYEDVLSGHAQKEPVIWTAKH